MPDVPTKVYLIAFVTDQVEIEMPVGVALALQSVVCEGELE